MALGEKSKATRTKKTGALQKLRELHRDIDTKLAARQNRDGKPSLDRDIQQIFAVWLNHDMLEESVLAPAVQSNESLAAQFTEGQVERDLVKLLIREASESPADDPYLASKLEAFSRLARELIRKEEKRGGIFSSIEAAGILGDEFQTSFSERQQQLDQQQEGISVPRALVSLPTVSAGQTSKENDYMNRSNERDRDERGRFTSDDDRDNGRRGRSSYGGNDDDRRYSRSSRSDDDDRRFSSGSRWDDDDRRYSRNSDDDDRGYSRSSRSDDEGRGWHGDREGHSEASRRGWDDRRSSRGGDYDDNGRRSSSRSGEYASQGGNRYYDDDRRGGSRGGRSHGGWFGDSEGHSEAAQRGWEEREGSSRSRSRRDDDDDGRRRSSRGGRDEGGWFGDSEGHAEAARRGWENRR